MTIDFKSNHVVMFGFNTTISLTEGIRARIRDLGLTDRRGNIFIDEESEVAGSNLRVVASISKVARSDNKFTIAVSFISPRRRRLAKKVGKTKSPITELFTSLSGLQQECTFECRLISQFRRRDKAIPIVKLPLKVTEFPGAAFSEIRGIHLTSKDGADSVDAILDTDFNGLQEVVNFHYSQKFSQSIAQEIWIRGLELSKLYVVRG